MSSKRMHSYDAQRNRKQSWLASLLNVSLDGLVSLQQRFLTATGKNPVERKIVMRTKFKAQRRIYQNALSEQ